MHTVKLILSTLTLVALTVSFSFDSAQSAEIELKHSFWSGWRYSVDGMQWESVGMSGESLRALMEGDDEAQEEMRLYKSYKIKSLITGISTAGLSITGALLYYDDKEWEATEISLLAGGIVMGIITSYFENSALNHLLKAVHLYNFGEPTSSISSALDNYPIARESKGVGVSIALKFR
jgi:hypothetical protein